MTQRVKDILSWYGSDNPGTLTNLARMLNHGKLAGTGKLVILPVDQALSMVRRAVLHRIHLLMILAITLSWRSQPDVMLMLHR
jgi:DhnA family fructose-bisphosphate aldolase class Ia